MSLSIQSAPISAQARTCLVSFQQCLQRAVDLDTQRYSNLEDQRARFSIWTSNMAVFASPKACMDHRVREVPHVQRLVLGILGVLEGRLEECFQFIQLATEPDTPVESKFALLASGDFERSAGAIASQINLLHGLSNTIRKASRDTQNVKAATSFRIKDADGNDMEDCLRHYLQKALSDRFPESSDSIRARICSTMLHRRKRILHRRDRYSTKPATLPLPVTKPKLQPPLLPQRKEFDGGGMAQHSRKEAQLHMSTSVGPSAIQSATTLAPQNFQRASAPSTVSHTKTVDLGSHENLVFPPAPRLQSRGMVETTCPYCLFALPTPDISTPERWRKHVLGDLDALVCLFEPCDEPEVLYSHSKDWLQHMNKHVQCWRCSLKPHDTKVFYSRGDFDKHFEEDHRKNYSKAQLELLAERALQPLGTLFQACPLCGGADDPDASGTLTDHIIGHLRSLALKSLPPYYEDGDDELSNSNVDEQCRSRSTLKNLLTGQQTSLAFSTVSDQTATQTEKELIPVDPEWPNRKQFTEDWLYSGQEAPFGGDLSPLLINADQPRNDPTAFVDDSLLSVKAPEKQLIYLRIPNPNPPSSQPALSFDGLSFDGAVYDEPQSQASSHRIAATFEGFKANILHLNPRLAGRNKYLIDRIARHQVSRFKALVNNRIEHLKEVSIRPCPSGGRCKLTLRSDLPSFLSSWEYQELLFSTRKEVNSSFWLADVPLPAPFIIPGEFECDLCFQVKKLSRRSDWTQHIHEDLQPLICTWENCHRDSEVEIGFTRRLDWVRHEMEEHRHLEWWTCNVDDCRHISYYRRDDFVQHLVRDHKYPELKPVFAQTATKTQDAIRQKTQECHRETTLRAEDEPCRFCGRKIQSWEMLLEHLAWHMERISRPFLELVVQQNSRTDTISDPLDEHARSEAVASASESPPCKPGSQLSPTPSSNLFLRQDSPSHHFSDYFSLDHLDPLDRFDDIPPFGLIASDWAVPNRPGLNSTSRGSPGATSESDKISAEVSTNKGASPSHSGPLPATTKALRYPTYGERQTTPNMDAVRSLDNKKPLESNILGPDSMLRGKHIDQNEPHEDDDAVRCICGFQECPGIPPLYQEEDYSVIDSMTDALYIAPDSLAASSGFYIQCDTCQAWQHGFCVGIFRDDEAPDEYFCEECRMDLHEIHIAKNGIKFSQYLPAQRQQHPSSLPRLPLPRPRQPETQTKTNRRVAFACLPGKKAHVRCDDQRPCTACVQKGSPDACADGSPPHGRRNQEDDETLPNEPIDSAAYDTPANGERLNQYYEDFVRAHEEPIFSTEYEPSAIGKASNEMWEGALPPNELMTMHGPIISIEYGPAATGEEPIEMWETEFADSSEQKSEGVGP